MKVTDYIREAFGRTRDRILFSHYSTPSWAWSPCERQMPFGRVVWSNITEIMASIANDVTFTNLSPDKALTFASFKHLFELDGEHIITRLFDDGAVAIGYDDTLGFWLMKPSEYTKTTIGDDTILTANRPEIKMYVMRSSTFESKGISDRTMCEPFIQFIDNALNASNTASARLGALIVGSPMQSSAMPTATVLTKEQKHELEKSLSQEYGSLSGQKQFLLLPRSMNFQTISLAAIDQRTADKVRLAILAICDRIKVPANQVAIIDANSSKSLSNGSELREGDFNKYQAFERLLNRTFVRMAMEAGLSVDYTIYNKPARQQ